VTLLHHRYAPPPGSGAPTLLLIHPMGASLDFWDACLPAWQGRYGILAVDLRCAGASPCAAEPPGLDTHAADLEALRRALSATRLVPVACAVGCMVAASYAARHPAQVAAMVLSNPTPRSTEAAREALVARAAAVRRGGMAAILPAAVERPFAEQPRDARYLAYLGAFAAQHPEAYAQSVLGFATADARADFARTACPALLVPAAHDLLLPPPLAEEVAALMPRGLARIALDLEGAHFLPYQRPTAFAARVTEFLGHLDAEGA
jgi:3-oxoadipate enol-lactonase